MTTPYPLVSKQDRSLPSVVVSALEADVFDKRGTLYVSSLASVERQER